MASASQPKYTYDVFLSFRGLNTRYGFISHLCEALDIRSIRKYIDSEDLNKGEPIAVLMKAIEESRFAVIVFSEDYATSAWCLDEVVKIVERDKSKSLDAMPVFYKVQPGEVRNSEQRCKKAFDEKKEKYKNDPKIVDKWNNALQYVADLTGWVFSDVVIAESAEGKSTKSVNREIRIAEKAFQLLSPVRNEAELKNSIADKIWEKLEREHLYVPTHRFGIDSQLDDLKAELNKKYENEVRGKSPVIVLWAMGGMGKSMLARVLYNSMSCKFEGSAFLESMDQNPTDSNSMVSWQKRMLFQILKREETVDNESQGKNLIIARLQCRRVLLILDGVETPKQITALAGRGDWFGNGSRIIVTTRNKALLSPNDARIYEVRALKNRDALKLFKKCVSEDEHINISGKHVRRVLTYTQRLPLALEKLGHVFRASSDWETELNAFARNCRPEIRVELEKSYNGLDSADKKEIFLHIACLFNGWIRNYVEVVLGSCYSDVAKTVKDLIERSLIGDENGTLQVHVLVELMARDIVDEACRDNPATRSRIWHFSEFKDALSRKKEENAAVKAIVVDLEKPQKIDIGPDGFENLKMLEFLMLNNVDTNFKGSIRLPKELRWCEWHGCCASGLKFTDTPRKLVVLSVGRKNLERTGETMI